MTQNQFSFSRFSHNHFNIHVKVWKNRSQLGLIFANLNTDFDEMEKNVDYEIRRKFKED